MKEYDVRILKPRATRHENKPESDYEQARLKDFSNKPEKNEDTQLLLAINKFHYYGAVRATRACLGCHRRDNVELKEGDLLAVVKIEVPTTL